ncbi:hypothetical protein Aduo_014055 [Ancylostoma duodenale]
MAVQSSREYVLIQIITNGDELSKWKVVKCSETAYAYVCKKAGSGNTGGGYGSGNSGGGHGSGNTGGGHGSGNTGGVDGSDPGSGTGKDTGPFPHQFKGNKFGIFYYPEKVTFLQARFNCCCRLLLLTAVAIQHVPYYFLVTLTSSSIVQSNSTLMEDAWIGMVYSVSSTDVKKTWVDESPFDYSNFAPLESKFSTEGVYCGQIIGNGDKFSKWKIVDCSEEAHTYVCKKTSPPKPATPAPTNAPTARPPPRRTWPPPPPPTLPPPEDTTTEPATDIPNPDPATCDPDPTTPDSEVPPECRPVYISEYDQTVKEKGCYPV